MWKAGGSDPSKRPYEWLRSAQAREFAEFLGDAGISRNALLEQERGGAAGGATWAHWQLALPPRVDVDAADALKRERQ
jgi:hypothetical protein